MPKKKSENDGSFHLPKLRLWVVILVLATFVGGFLVGIWTAFATAGTGNLPTDIEQDADGNWQVHDHSNPDHDHSGHDHAHHEVESDDHDSDSHAHHAHEMYKVSSNIVNPSVVIFAEKDSVSGYNVFIDTEEFTFTPEDVGGADVPGEGHAHIYVNGEKVARIYSNWYHLTDLSEGEHEVRVTLNSNSHGQYVVDDVPVESTTTITV